MLIHHFGAETQGFQGLVDQNDRGKAFSPRKLTFSSRDFFNLTEKICCRLNKIVNSDNVRTPLGQCRAN